MKHLCDNQYCRLHEFLIKKHEDFVRLYVHGEVIQTERKEYKDGKTGREFYLCTSCHGAAQMMLSGGANNG